MKSFWDNLKEAKTKKGLSQGKPAELMQIHSAHISRYERNQADVVKKFADALEVSPDYLAGHSDLLPEYSVQDRMLDIQRLSEKDQEHLFAVVDAYLRDAKTKKAYVS